MKEIINQQYENAKEILIQTQHILAKGAKILLENEKIEGKEFQELMRGTQDESSAKFAS